MLAQYMLEWEMMKEELDAQEDDIKRIVLQLGETVTVGNVKASYSKGRTVLDYEGAVMLSLSDYSDKEMAVLEKSKEVNSTVKTSISWKNVCEDMGIKLIPELSHSGPSVTVKLC